MGILRGAWFSGKFCRSLDLGEGGGLETGALDLGLAWYFDRALDLGLAWVSGKVMEGGGSEGGGFRDAGDSMGSKSMSLAMTLGIRDV